MTTATASSEAARASRTGAPSGAPLLFANLSARRHPMGMAVKLKSQKSNPVFGVILFFLLPVISLAVFYFGIPGTTFNGVREGVFFGMDYAYNNGFGDQGAGRIMDNRIVCTSAEAQAFVRQRLQLVFAGSYPTDSFVIELQNYPAGYRYRYTCKTWYAQRLNIGGEGRLFRKGSQVGDPRLDADVAARHKTVADAIDGALEEYFKSKGAH